MTGFHVRSLLLVLLSLILVDSSSRREPGTLSSAAPNLATTAATIAKLPARFEANAGQLDQRVRFVARRGSASLFLSDDGATLAIHHRNGSQGKAHARPTPTAPPSVIALKVAGGRSVAPVAGTNLGAKTNYLVGLDRSKWRTHVATYASVTYPSVLDGVDLVYHGENGPLEYDFVVAPGARVDSIAMNVEGAADLSLTASGDLAIHTASGDLIQPKPLVYQRGAHGDRVTVASSYRLVGKTAVGFEVAAYDRRQELVIDPPIAFAKFIGGSIDDAAVGIATDAFGSSYLVGTTFSDDLPVTPLAYDKLAGCVDCQSRDAFVAKLNPAGGLDYVTYLGGSEDEEAYAIAVDNLGRAYAAGATRSALFPTTPNTQTPDTQVLFPSRDPKQLDSDGFVTRLSQDGSALGYSTLFRPGANRDDAIYGIAVDANYNAYVTGETAPFFFGQTDAVGPIGRGGSGDAFIAKIAPAGDLLAQPLRIMAGSNNDVGIGIAVDAAANVYVTGYTSSSDLTNAGAASGPPIKPCDSEGLDAWVAKLNADFSGFAYATCFGSTGFDVGYGIAVDAGGTTYVTGTTNGTIPTTAGAFQAANNGSTDAFVIKLTADGAVVYATHLGGSEQESGWAIALDGSGSVWVSGTTGSSETAETAFPLKFPVQATFGGGNAEGPRDAYVTRLNAAGSDILFSSYYGGAQDDDGTGIAVNASSVRFCGASNSLTLPLGANANTGGQDGFVVGLSVPPLLISPPSVLVPVAANQQFTAVGGTGFGYSFAVTVNNSGGSIAPDGLYTAGVTGGVTDAVTVTDAAGTTATATVTVGTTPPNLIISPANTSSPPRGSKTFSASGGVPPYGFSFASNASSGTISPAGLYTAGRKGSVVDVVRVTDNAGSTVTATVTVGAALVIAPPKPAAPPKGKIDFTATGGSGSGLVWSISTNASGGTIGAASGKYDAGNGSSTVDTVQVTDSLGNTAQVNVSVGGGLAVTPAAPATPPRGTIVFSAVGGSGAYSWTLTSALSGGTIDAATGQYTAGANGSVADLVRVQDSVGNSSTVQVTVGPQLALTPASTSVVSGAQVAYSASGGSGTYSFAITTNQSGAAIGPSNGIYIAGANVGTDNVRLTDSLGAVANATVNIAAQPGSGGPATSLDGGTFNGINIAGGANDDCDCHAVGGGARSNASRTIAALVLAFVVLRRRRRR